MVDEHRRVAALSTAVALTTAALDHVEVDRAALLDGLDEREVTDALVWLAALLTEHAPYSTGPVILQVTGQVAAWVSAGGAG